LGFKELAVIFWEACKGGGKAGFGESDMSLFCFYFFVWMTWETNLHDLVNCGYLLLHFYFIRLFQMFIPTYPIVPLHLLFQAKNSKSRPSLLTKHLPYSPFYSSTSLHLSHLCSNKQTPSKERSFKATLSSQTPPSSQTRPRPNPPWTHTQQCHRQARLYLRRCPTRRGSDAGNARTRACRGRGSVSIVLCRICISLNP
jgi:hypothetical protein